jgi:hypothetical protein
VPQKKKKLEGKRSEITDLLNGYCTSKDFVILKLMLMFKLRKFVGMYITHIKGIKFFTQICYDGLI